MDAADAVSAYLASLEVAAEPDGPGAWRLRLDAAGLPFELALAVRGELVRAEAVVLPPELIDPHQLLHWNAQAPFVCFAENRAGELLVCGEMPVRGLDPELLDRFLGLLHASATRARRFVLPDA